MLCNEASCHKEWIRVKGLPRPVMKLCSRVKVLKCWLIYKVKVTKSNIMV